MSIRILIADDHRILRAGLKTFLTTDPNLEVVGEATNGEETIRAARTTRPDIVLMDMSMPDTDGLETLSSLRREAPDSRVLVLTMHEDNALLQETLRSGAAGYIIKRAAESELIDAIYAVWRGIVYIHPSLLQSWITPPARVSPALPLESETLTSRESEILRFIVQGHTNRQIANALSISVRTVETHRANLMDKLNLHSRVDLVRYASQHGLLKG
ncbi:MAG TPA: response regulator transcription factor [Anaerolineaceae bacterium]|nr:response regulator transcription factor [Anaerolineaceae bacterium]